jgi:hypothetical protein
MFRYWIYELHDDRRNGSIDNILSDPVHCSRNDVQTLDMWEVVVIIGNRNRVTLENFMCR